MPSRARVEAFIASVVGGDHVRAIADYYHENASMQERMKMHTHPNPLYLLDGDNVVINWIFDATGKDGITRRLNELALQRWDGDRIAEERFVYDAASAWTVVHAPSERPSNS